MFIQNLVRNMAIANKFSAFLHENNYSFVQNEGKR